MACLLNLVVVASRFDARRGVAASVYPLGYSTIPRLVQPGHGRRPDAERRDDRSPRTLADRGSHFRIDWSILTPNPPTENEMSWLMAALYDRACTQAERAGLSDWRAELMAGLAGSVLEVGAGTGLNLPHYPGAVTRLVLSEPDRHMQRQLERKFAGGFAQRGEIVAASLDHLPMGDSSFDAVVATLVLCSVANPVRALSEIRRVLRPGGRFVFLEHVAADPQHAATRYKWQGRIEPLWKHLAGNCHLRRETGRAIEDAGFGIEWIKRAGLPKAPFWVRPSIRGVARKVT
jgi:ubiquinone/menaquinone biosynthesis C-methylase UbiE